ncbi:hypothetical protein [Arenimonas sp. GDDSR-1]|uniref:hypothetical protein n=1 Tax=Arenimonas sp. GDDSR-1 TaxID=2950125 RepID=UPI00262360E6|nr:hypothetical protein [Arenimonas sp. GDDSR-1]
MLDSGTCVILLPEKRCFAGQRPSDRFARYSRRFKTDAGDTGESRQLQRHFHCFPESGWPIAALCRQRLSGDAGTAKWLRADPIYLQAEMRGARVMAISDFALTADDVDAVVSALQPAFADHGFGFSAGADGSFYIRSPENTELPEFLPLMDLLGCDLAGQLSNDRTWTGLFNECQITLHNHPLNVQRQRSGLLPVNGLWFWGGGVLPAAVTHNFETIHTDDSIINALTGHSEPERGGDVLLDLRHIRSWPDVESRFDESRTTLFDFADGSRWHWRPNWRLQFWRRNSIPVF